MRALVVAVTLVALVGCGKNDPFAPVGGPGGYYAPPPPNGGYPMPSGMPYNPYQYQPGRYPQPGGYPYAGGFNPYQNTGYPNQFSPFLPVYDWMQRDPYRQQYWNQMWGGWNNYCQVQGCHPYDFQRFWSGYVPNCVGVGEPWYAYFNTQFYGWMQPGFQFQGGVPPGAFWQYYGGASFAPLNEYYRGYGWGY